MLITGLRGVFMNRDNVADYISKFYACDIVTAQRVIAKVCIDDLTTLNIDTISSLMKKLEKEGFCNFSWRQPKDIGKLIQKLVRDCGWSDDQFYEILNSNNLGYKLPQTIINHLYTSPKLRDWMVNYLESLLNLAPNSLLLELIIDDKKS